jgi:hypothetical protein
MWPHLWCPKVWVGPTGLFSVRSCSGVLETLSLLPVHARVYTTSHASELTFFFFFVFGVGLTAMTVDLAPDSQKGSILSLTRQAGDVAFLVGPLGLGMLAEATSYSTAIGLTAAVMAASNAAFAVFAKEVKF